MALISGQITIAAPGTAQAGPSVQGHTFVYQAHPANSDLVFVGNDGNDDVSPTNGLALNAGDSVALAVPPNKLRFDAVSANDKICWAVYSRN